MVCFQYPRRFVCLCLTAYVAAVATEQSQSQSQSPPSHKSNHAVIVSSSRYWFNYRHASNALSIYQMLKRHGIPDDNIVLMLADEYAVNARNPVKNGLYNTATDSLTQHHTSYGGDRRRSLLHGDGDSNHTNSNNNNIEIDYRGDDVTVEHFVNVLTGRTDGMPVLQSDHTSNVLVYLTGHGGDSFFKFQDVEELLADQLADAISQMHTARRYHELLLVADTCQAFTLGDRLVERQVPHVTILGSSLRDESSYAHMASTTLGLSTIEKYTHYFVTHVMEDYKKLHRQPQQTHPQSHDKPPMYHETIHQAMVEGYSRRQLGATIGVADGTARRPVTETPLRDFFANVQSPLYNYYDDHDLNDSDTAVPVVVVDATVGRPSSLSRRRTAVVSNTNKPPAARPNECTVSSSQANHKSHSNQPQQRHRHAGWNPDDPRFVAIAVAFLGSVALASRRW